MAKVTYNVKGVDSSDGDFTPVKPGMYQAKIIEINSKESSKNGPMLEVVMEVVADSKGGTKFEGKGSKLWSYILLEHEPSAFRLREFLEAVGKVKGKKGEAGTLDTDALVKAGIVVQVRVKSDTNLDGEYRPKVGKILALDADAGEAEAEAEDEPEEDEEDDDEEEGEDEESEDEEDEETVDLSELDRAELKKLIKDEKLEIKVLKSMSDDDLREAIAAALGAEDEEESDEEEDEEDDEAEAGPDFDSMDRAELKAFIKENELDVKVLKKDSDDDLREKVKAAAGSGDDESPDYNSWSGEQLKAELKERGLPLSGSNAVKAQRLKKDDESDSDPF